MRNSPRAPRISSRTSAALKAYCSGAAPLSEQIAKTAGGPDRAVAGLESFDADIDELPIRLLSHVATPSGVCTDPASALQPECAFAPELLRSSPI